GRGGSSRRNTGEMGRLLRYGRRPHDRPEEGDDDLPKTRRALPFPRTRGFLEGRRPRYSAIRWRGKKGETPLLDGPFRLSRGRKCRPLDVARDDWPSCGLA